MVKKNGECEEKKERKALGNRAKKVNLNSRIRKGRKLRIIRSISTKVI